MHIYQKTLILSKNLIKQTICTLSLKLHILTAMILSKKTRTNTTKAEYFSKMCRKGSINNFTNSLHETINKCNSKETTHKLQLKLN